MSSIGKTANPSSPQTDTGSKRILSVSALTSNVRLLIEKTYPMVWVTGEISNLARPGSGHWYFTLKDAKSQLRCAMFANKNRRLRFKPANGDQVVLRGNLSLYTGRGDFQMIVEHMEPAGEGALRVAFEALKNKLEAEGLFREDIKQDFLEYPEHICIISSASGAAVHDVLSVLARRYPIAQVTLLPVLVQGPGSEADVIAALAQASNIDADLVILTRGGGSLEDLWTFNLEGVVRAVADCPVPLISAIGHETDFTLTDFAADLRAPTPSVAAELATPDGAELLRGLMGAERALRQAMLRQLRNHQSQLTSTTRRLIPPQRILQQLMQRADNFELQLGRNQKARLQQAQLQLNNLGTRLLALSPKRTLERRLQSLLNLRDRLHRSQSHGWAARNTRLAALARALNAVSPLHTMERGFAIVTKGPASKSQPWGEPLADANTLNAGDELLAHLGDGTLACEVKQIRPLPAQLGTTTPSDP